MELLKKTCDRTKKSEASTVSLEGSLASILATRDALENLMVDEDQAAAEDIKLELLKAATALKASKKELSGEGSLLHSPCILKFAPRHSESDLTRPRCAEGSLCIFNKCTNVLRLP